MLVPFGGVAFRVSLLGAVCGAVAVSVVYGLAVRVASAAGLTRPAVHVLGVAAGVALMGSGAHLAEASRPEVYALNAAIVLLALDRAARFAANGDLRDARLGMVWLGLGLTNHHYLVVFALPAVALAWFLRPEGRAAPLGRWVGLVALGLAGLVLYAYLPLRAATDPVIDWGHPVTLPRFLDALTAKTFQQSVSAETRGAPIADNVMVALGMWGDSVGPLVLALGLTGALLTWRLDRKVGAVLAVALLGNLATKAIMFIDPENPDDYGYFYVGIALVAVASISPIVWLAARLSPSRWPVWIGAGVLLGAAAVGAPERLARVDRSHDTSAEAFSDAILSPLAPHAVALVDFFQLYFATWYGQLVEGARPDVAVVQASFDSKRYDGEPYVAALERRHPRLSPIVAAFRADRAFPRAALLTYAEATPVYLEPTVDERIEPSQLGETGLLRRVRPSGSAEPALEQTWGRLARAVSQTALIREGRTVLDWTCFLGSTLLLQQRATDRAREVMHTWRTFGEAGPPERLARLAGRTFEASDEAERAAEATRPFLGLWARSVADVAASVTPRQVFAR